MTRNRITKKSKKL